MQVPPLGSEKEHKEWDAREELRPLLGFTVKRVLGIHGDVAVDDDEFIFTLLCDNAVIEALKEELPKIIEHRRETRLTPSQRREMLAYLEAASRRMPAGLKAASNSVDLEEMNKATLNLLLEDKNIFEATQALKVRVDTLKVSMESNDEEGMRAAAKGAGASKFKLQMLLLEKIRYFAFSVHLIKTFMMMMQV